MKTDPEKLKAKMAGAKAALEGRKLDANTYAETDELHFLWLIAWTDTRREMAKKQSPCPRCGQPGPHFMPPSLGEPGRFICERVALVAETYPQFKP